jgi:hypothetical protein
MLVSTADGEPHECDDVVLAVPPSVWPKIDFFPRASARPAPADGIGRQISGDDEAGVLGGKKLFAQRPHRSGNQRTWDATEKQGAGQAALCAFSGGPVADGRGRSVPPIAIARYALISTR